MERVVRKFANHQEQEEADRLYYKSLTPAQRLEILLELINSHVAGHDEPSTRLQRVYRIVKFESG